MGIRTLPSCSVECAHFSYFVHATDGDGNCKCCTGTDPLSELLISLVGESTYTRNKGI